MDPNSNSPELTTTNQLLRRTLRPMLRFVASQRLINWLGHKAKPLDGPLFEGAHTQAVTLGTVPCIQASPDKLTDAGARILYFHGGAYTTMSAGTHAPHARRLAAQTGRVVICPDYRIAIYAPYPAAVDDAEASFDALLAQGIAPEKIALAGDSAGGGLVFALLLRLKAKGKPMPACAVTQSPWVDLTLSQPSITENAKSDVLLPRAWLVRAANLYAGDCPKSHPELSPLNADLTGLPPQLLLYSTVELLSDECALMAQRLTQSGIVTRALAHHHAPHAWAISAPLTPEAQAAYDEISGFLSEHFQPA